MNQVMCCEHQTSPSCPATFTSLSSWYDTCLKSLLSISGCLCSTLWPVFAKPSLRDRSPSRDPWGNQEVLIGVPFACLICPLSSCQPWDSDSVGPCSLTSHRSPTSTSSPLSFISLSQLRGSLFSVQCTVELLRLLWRSLSCPAVKVCLRTIDRHCFPGSEKGHCCIQ